MEFIKPIRDRQVIREIRKNLKETDEQHYMIFTLGIYTGLHIADILSLQVGDVKGTHIEIQEKETDIKQRIRVSQELRNELDTYIAKKPDDEYLFKKIKTEDPIKTDEFYKMFESAALRIGMTGPIGPETLRKTFGYHMYKQSDNPMTVLNALTALFNHKNSLETIEYLEIHTQEDIDRAMSAFSL